MATRIICIGNRYVHGDDFGPRVYDCLAGQPVPASIDIVDGGLAGLGLLRYLEDGRRVLFIDTVAGFTAPGEIVLLGAAEVAGQCARTFGHEAGLPYLLRVMPAVLDSPPPVITVIGHEGEASTQTVQAAAQLALRLATEAATAVADEVCRA